MIAPDSFASRSDPRSANYQAWFGVYIVVPAAGSQTGPALDLRKAIGLTEEDQRSWLEAMGDPQPLAQSLNQVRTRTSVIGGANSHSDLGPGRTQLAKSLGVPPAEDRHGLSDFHPVTLHVVMAFWYDRMHRVSVVTYGVSARFRDGNGRVQDTEAALTQSLQSMMTKVRLSS